MGKVMGALGLMSGTSMDGIDVAFIRTDGEDSVERGPAMTVPYSPEMRARLAQGLRDARALVNRTARPGILDQLEIELTLEHGLAVTAFCNEHNVARSLIEVVGFHGHTVLHRAPTANQPGLTVQIGDGKSLVWLSGGCDVVYDMRAADVAAGGNGAPLVSVYHRALAARVPQRPLAIVNIGGVANITVIDANDALTAFDTGPGSALIDDWMSSHGAGAFDADGATAARGKIDEDLLRDWLSHPFFAATPPKSLDRNAFAMDKANTATLENGAATLTAFTARSIARAREHMNQEPALWVITGGGRRNATLMAALAQQVENAVAPAEALGWNGDSMEAEAWAYLAVRSLRGLPLTYPSTTGVSSPCPGGVLAKAPPRS